MVETQKADIAQQQAQLAEQTNSLREQSRQLVNYLLLWLLLLEVAFDTHGSGL